MKKKTTNVNEKATFFEEINVKKRSFFSIYDNDFIKLC